MYDDPNLLHTNTTTSRESELTRSGGSEQKGLERKAAVCDEPSILSTPFSHPLHPLYRPRRTASIYLLPCSTRRSTLHHFWCGSHFN